MTENETLDLIKKEYTLYSSTSIDIATFLGSPIASGILIRKNFITLGEPTKGRNALLLSVLFTLGIIFALLLLPDSFIDKIPSMIIPIFMVLSVRLIVDKTMGNALKEHKEKEGTFFSGWRAAGIALLCSAAFVPLLFIYAFYGPEDFDTETYNAKIEEYSQNEAEAFVLFDLLESNDDKVSIDFIKNIGLPRWERNVIIANELDEIEGLDAEFTKQNQVLRDYAIHRIEQYKLIRLGILEGMDKYSDELNQKANEIEKTLSQL